MTLLSAVILLKSDKQTIPWLGRAAQAWLLHQVEQHNPALSARLHKGTQSRRPYTVYVTPESLHVTSVDSNLSTILRDSILPTIQTLTLASIEFTVANQPQSESTDFETLAHTAFNGEILSTLAFEFISPTAFHSGLLTIPLPLPTLLFGSLIQAWNTFSPVSLPVTLQDFVEQYIGISKHHIKTCMVKLGTHEQHIGFTGTAEYMIIPKEKTAYSPDEYRLRIQTLTLLSHFAAYVGVGIRTTVGMGQVRLTVGANGIRPAFTPDQSSGR